MLKLDLCVVGDGEEGKKFGGRSSGDKYLRECRSRVSSTFITIIILEPDNTIVSSLRQEPGRKLVWSVLLTPNKEDWRDG